MNCRSFLACTRYLLLLLAACCWWTTDLSAQCGSNTTVGTFCNTRSNFFDAQYNADQGCGTYRTITNYSPGEYFRMPVLSGGCYSIQTCGAPIDTQIMCFQGNNTTGPFAYNDDNGPLCGGNQASVNITPNFTDYTRVDVRQFNCRPGGTSSITVRIRQNNNLTITSSAANMCEGQTRGLTATPARTTTTPINGSGNRGTFTGTGVSGTTFTAPTPAGASQTFTITYTFGFCTRTQSITVFRNPSTANAGPDQTVANNATLAANTPAFGTGVWSVVNGSGTFSNASDPNATVTGLGNGTNTFRWTITNGPCSASTDDVIITKDNLPPSITCPSTQTAGFDNNCQYSIPDLTTLATVTDNVDPNPQVFQSPPAGTTISGTGGTATQTITLVALDASNNSASCTFTLNVQDNIAPTISCPGTQTVVVDSACSAVVPDFTGSALFGDNCSAANNITISQSPAPGSVINTSTTITLTVTDESTNSNSCNFALNLQDNDAPVAACNDVTLQLDAGGSATLSPSDINNVSTDNCTSIGNLALSVSPSNVGCGDVGSQLATLTVADQAGNTDSCSANLTVEDNIAPNAVCQSSSTLYLDASGNAVLSGSLVDAGSSDNCSIQSRTVSDTTFDCTNLGANSVTLTVTDPSGNISTCTAPVTVADSLAPTITDCPSDTTVGNTLSNCSAIVFWNTPSATDNCNLSSLTPSTASGSTFPIGTTAVTYTALDQSSNSTVCTFNVTVVDNELPDLNCPSNVTVNADTGQCAAAVSWAAPTPTDNCGLDTTFSSRAIGDTFVVGTSTVFYVATDIYNNSDTCSFTVEVIDAEAPEVTCPANITIPNDSGFCAALVSWNPISATDNCGIDTAMTSVPNNSVFNVGTTQVLYTATDIAGNIDSCTFDVEVVDATAPLVLCPSPSAVSNDPGQCSAIVSFNAPNAFDNCGVDTILATSISGDTFPVGTTPVSVIALDGANNADTCNFNVVVNDIEDPVVTCPADTILLADSSTCSASASWNLPQSSDNCGVSTLTPSTALGTSLPVGTTTVFYLAVDPSGNTDTCNFDVTVQPAPFIVVNSQSSLVCGAGVSCNGATDGTASAVAQGGCLPYAYTWSTGDSTQSIGGLGAGTYVVTVTDGNNAVSVDTFVLTEPAPLQSSIAADTAICLGANDGDIDLTVTGGADCQAYTYAWSTGDSTEDLTGLADGVYTVTITDANGCSVVDSVTILGTPSPVVNLGPDQQVCGGDFVTLGSGGGGGGATFLWSTGDTTSSISVNATGTYSLTVTNSIGCSGSDSVNVTNFPVNDTVITPRTDLFICLSDSVELTASSAFTNYLWSTGEVSQSIQVGAPGGLISVEATDGNGCTVLDTVEVIFKNVANPVPVVIPGPNVALCQGTSVDLDAGSFAAYTWSTGDTNQTLKVTTVGTFTVTVTNADGCTGESAPVTVTSVPNPTPGITQSNDSLLATGGPFATYQWLLNSATINGATNDFYVPNTTGTYSVTVTDANGCEGTSDTTFILVGAEAAANNLLGIDLYPNPSNGLIHVRTLNPINWDVNIVVTDMYGKVVRAYDFGSIQNKVDLDLTDVANGMYLLKIRDEKGRSNIIRFVIE